MAKSRKAARSKSAPKRERTRNVEGAEGPTEASTESNPEALARLRFELDQVRAERDALLEASREFVEAITQLQRALPRAAGDTPREPRFHQALTSWLQGLS
jgi:hypothetical protein